MDNSVSFTIAVSILFTLAIATIPATIAERKGRSFGLWYFYSVFLFVIALIHAALMEANENAPDKKKCRDCSRIIPKEALACSYCGTRFDGDARSTSRADAPTPSNRPLKNYAPVNVDPGSSNVIFDGDRSLNNPRYQTFLVKTYAIEKNSTLDKFIVDLDPFDDLSSALAFAHGLESVNARRSQEPAPVPVEKVAPPPVNHQKIALELSTLSELDQADIHKLKSYQYKLVGIESKAGSPVFTLRSTTNGSEFELEGSVKLRDFAAQF